MATATSFRPAGVPLKDRQKNDVDVRLEQIAWDQETVRKIQAACNPHDYRLDSVPEFEATKKSGCYGTRSGLSSNLVCLNCSDTKPVMFFQTCPCCHASMTRGSKPVSAREHYNGRPDFEECVEYECSSCGFTLVMLSYGDLEQPLV